MIERSKMKTSPDVNRPESYDRIVAHHALPTPGAREATMSVPFEPESVDIFGIDWYFTGTDNVYYIAGNGLQYTISKEPNPDHILIRYHFDTAEDFIKAWDNGDAAYNVASITLAQGDRMGEIIKRGIFTQFRTRMVNLSNRIEVL